MLLNKAKKASEKASEKAPRKRKLSYERSTPVTRLGRNVVKIARHAQLCRERILAWISAKPDDRLTLAASLAERIENLAIDLGDKVAELDRTGFVPAKPSEVWNPEVGERVAVADAFREKYAAVFAAILKDDPGMLDGLVVQSTLPTGEIVVQRGKRTPFPVRKSHLCQAAE